MWWTKAASNSGVKDAILLSVLTASLATIIALILGSLAAAAIARYNFFGRDVISLMFVLPIALPGIVTGIALNNVFTNFFGGLTFFTIIIGHATFCVVIVYNNVIARFRRTSHSLIEANSRLGRGCIVCAGSQVRGEFAEFSVLEGAPARVIGDSRRADKRLLLRARDELDLTSQ